MSIDLLRQDLRYTLRTLRRDAGFTTFVILIAGLGIGASATVFSVINTLLLRPLPFAEPGQLVWIANRDTSGLSGQTTQVGHMLDLRERTQTLSALTGYFAFYGVGDNLLSGKGEPERLSGVPSPTISSMCSGWRRSSAGRSTPRMRVEWSESSHPEPRALATAL